MLEQPPDLDVHPESTTALVIRLERKFRVGSFVECLSFLAYCRAFPFIVPRTNLRHISSASSGTASPSSPSPILITPHAASLKRDWILMHAEVTVTRLHETDAMDMDP